MTKLHRVFLFSTVLLAACGGDKPAPGAASSAEPATAQVAPGSAPAPKLLVANMQGNAGLVGVVVLAGHDGTLLLGGALDGVAPGEHAIHVHEVGDCSAADFTSAGGHFAPAGRPHGGPDVAVEQRHAGDFGNFTASAFGQGKFGIKKDSDRSLAEFAGRAIIVHAGADDFTSQPSGAAGPRIGCGVLEPADY